MKLFAHIDPFCACDDPSNFVTRLISVFNSRIVLQVGWLVFVGMKQRIEGDVILLVAFARIRDLRNGDLSYFGSCTRWIKHAAACSGDTNKHIYNEKWRTMSAVYKALSLYLSVPGSILDTKPWLCQTLKHDATRSGNLLKKCRGGRPQR